MSKFKVGDRVRVIKGGLHGDHFESGEECFIVQVRDGDCRLQSLESGKKWYARKTNLEHIKGDDMPKYSTTKPIQVSQLYEQHKHECPEFFKHFASLLHELKPSSMSGFLYQESFIPWAEKDPKRIKWLIEKGYVEEEKSAYDKWVDECPCESKKPSSNMGNKVSVRQENYIEWAKRMPRDK